MWAVHERVTFPMEGHVTRFAASDGANFRKGTAGSFLKQTCNRSP
jgi:hypothetical protein